MKIVIKIINSKVKRKNGKHIKMNVIFADNRSVV